MDEWLALTPDERREFRVDNVRRFELFVDGVPVALERSFHTVFNEFVGEGIRGMAKAHFVQFEADQHRGREWRSATTGLIVAVITRRRIFYWLAAMVALLLVGTVVGLTWADTSDVAGAFAVVTNIISVVGIVLALVALAVNRRRHWG